MATMGGKGMWTEHHDQDGRLFWYNAAQNVSAWHVPPGGAIAPSMQPTAPPTMPVANDGSFMENFLRMQQESTRGGVAAVPSSATAPPPLPTSDYSLGSSSYDSGRLGCGPTPPNSSSTSQGAKRQGEGYFDYPPSAQPQQEDASALTSKDPAQALKEKLAALAQQAQATKVHKPEKKRFRRGAAAAASNSGGTETQGNKGGAAAYLEMVRQLKSVDKETDGTGGKWLVR